MAFLDQFNTSELVEIAKHCEIPGFHGSGATKGYPREVVKRAILTLEPPEAPPAALDERERIRKFAKRHWQRIKSQVKYRRCPECIDGKEDRKTGKLERCSDVQATDCFIRNEPQLS